MRYGLAMRYATALGTGESDGFAFIAHVTSMARRSVLLSAATGVAPIGGVGDDREVKR